MPAHEHLGYQNPVVDTDFPDPGVFHDTQSGIWYAYGTNSNGKNIQVASSTDFCSWKLETRDALPSPHPPWTGVPGFNWAPEVVRAPGGRPGYLMYVSVKDRSTDKMSIGVAYSQASPLGPFHFVSNGPIVSRGETGGCIDPCPFIDPPTGRRFLVYKNDYVKMRGPGPQIWIQELAEDGIQFSADRRALLEPTHSWQTGLIEAPHLIFHPETRTYVLFFSSGTFTEADYKTGYAVSKSLFGPYKTGSYPLLETDEARGIIGPGGQSIVQGVEGNWFVCFHAHDQPGCKGGRRMCVHRIEFANDGTPILAGKAHYRRRLRLGAEAEDGIPEEEAQAFYAKHHSQRPFFAGSGGGSGNTKKAGKALMGALKKALN